MASLLIPRTAAAFLFSLILAGAALAQVTVSDPWVRATVTGQPASGAFMTLTAARGVRLVEARSPAAGVVEIHEMSMSQGVMRMRAVDALELPAGKAVELRPGGYHVMLMQLKAPLKTGDSVPITLVFEGPGQARETVEVKAPVRALTGGQAPAGHMKH